MLTLNNVAVSGCDDVHFDIRWIYKRNIFPLSVMTYCRTIGKLRTSTFQQFAKKFCTQIASGRKSQNFLFGSILNGLFKIYGTSFAIMSIGLSNYFYESAAKMDFLWFLMYSDWNACIWVWLFCQKCFCNVHLIMDLFLSTEQVSHELSTDFRPLIPSVKVLKILIMNDISYF